MVPKFRIRLVERADKPRWLELRQALWPHHRLEELESEIDKFYQDLDREPAFVCEDEAGKLLGFIEVSIRPKAAGCKTDKVGYIEGWYVSPRSRRQGIGRMLVEAAEGWAKRRGCREMASDTDDKYPLSPSAHKALGYAVVETSVHFRKTLTD